MGRQRSDCGGRDIVRSDVAAAGATLRGRDDVLHGLAAEPFGGRGEFRQAEERLGGRYQSPRVHARLTVRFAPL